MNLDRNRLMGDPHRGQATGLFGVANHMQTAKRITSAAAISANATATMKMTDARNSFDLLERRPKRNADG